jgi:hypothetical protein
LYEAFSKARVTVQVPEMSQQPRTKGTQLFSQIIANKITPEQFVDKYVAVVEKTLKKAGYIK